MTSRLAVAFVSLLLCKLHASVVDDRFLEALAHIESSGNPVAVGDGGAALGVYQFHAMTWAHVSALRKQASLSVHGYRSGATNVAIARSYAISYLRWLERNLTAKLGRSPCRAELYAAWNCGLEGFRRRGFQLSRCSTITQRAAALAAAH